MMRTRGIVVLGMLGFGVASATPEVWQEKMLVRDRISKDDGKTLELLGFSISRGDFVVEIDQLNRKIVGISGSFQDVDEGMFETLKARLAQSPVTGLKIEESDGTDSEGLKERTIRMDLQNLELAFAEDFIWTIRNSESLDVKLSLEKIGSKKVSLSLEMNLGDSIEPGRSGMTLLDRVQI